MAALASSEKIKVDKTLFDTLLRRADLHASFNASDGGQPSVSIPQVEYRYLDFDRLKNALFEGGLTAEHLAQLISGSGDSAASPWNRQASDYQVHCNRQSLGQPAVHDPWKSHLGTSFGSHPPSRGSNTHLGFRQQQHQTDDDSTFFDDGTTSDAESSADTSAPYGTAADAGTPHRTLYFAGLPPGTTHRDLLSVIKGGKVLLVSVRPEKSATVTLVSGATEFLTWAKRNDLYLKGKRIDVRWAERQYRLNSHVAHKIASGTTRNLLIHAALENGLDEKRIRADMEHIHNLVIVDVAFRGSDAYVSTNSVNNAMFARTCMMSRRDYKGRKITFFPDECDAPLPSRSISTSKPSERRIPTSKSGVPLTNKFGMLSMDDEGDVDSESETASTVPITYGRRTCDDDDVLVHS